MKAWGILCGIVLLACAGRCARPSIDQHAEIERKRMSNMEWGPTIGGWRLSSSLDKTAFKPLEPIVLTVVFENVSGGSQAYSAQGKDFDYLLECFDEDSRPLPPTLYGTRMKENRDIVKRITAELTAGQQLVNEILLNRHVDLSLPGKYTLTVTREVFPNEGRGERPVVSNTFAFEIRD